MPSRAYGNEWLQIRHQDSILLSLPKKGDPYEEIYKVNNKWYGLVYEARWLNPAGLDDRNLARTHRLLDAAKAFHTAIENTFHEQSYAHYGNDATRRAWHFVLWDISLPLTPAQVDALRLTGDSLQGRLTLTDSSRLPTPTQPSAGKAKLPPAPVSISAVLRPATDAGDQTVPVHSANSQLASRKFKGIFRQTGYEHQSSYSDHGALRSTLYSIIQIARTMTWSK